MDRRHREGSCLNSALSLLNTQHGEVIRTFVSSVKNSNAQGILNRTSKSKEDDTGDIIDALSSKLDSLQLEQNLESKPVFAGYRSSSFTQASWLHLAFLNFEERPHGPREFLKETRESSPVEHGGGGGVLPIKLQHVAEGVAFEVFRRTFGELRYEVNRLGHSVFNEDWERAVPQVVQSAYDLRSPPSFMSAVENWGISVVLSRLEWDGHER